MQQSYICEISYNYQGCAYKQFGEISVDISGKVEGEITDVRFDRPYRKIKGGTFLIDEERFIDYTELRVASRYADKHHIFVKKENFKRMEGTYQGRWILEKENTFEFDELDNTASLVIKLKET